MLYTLNRNEISFEKKKKKKKKKKIFNLYL
jgi:hypothetical protein